MSAERMVVWESEEWLKANEDDEGEGKGKGGKRDGGVEEEGGEDEAMEG